MVRHMIGYAELYGRLRHVVNVRGSATVNRHRDGDLRGSYFDPAGAPDCLHGHVLALLGVTVDPTSMLNFETASSVYPALGYPLTGKAATLADHTQQFTDAGQHWDDAVRLAVRLAAQDTDETEDRRVGGDTVVAVLRHLAAVNPPGMTAPPGWVPGTVALFLHGYPTLLAGHLAADLRLDAVTATTREFRDGVVLFDALGWALSPRATTALRAAEHAEAQGQTWARAADAAATAPRATLALPWDR
jgi:hypothetical protein